MLFDTFLKHFRMIEIPLLCGLCLYGSAAQAQELPFSLYTATATRAIPPEEAYLRAASVLDYFGVPEEPESQPFLQDLQNAQTPEGIQRILPYLELEKTFQNYVRFDTNTGLLSAFQDPHSKLVPDFSAQLVHEPNNSFSPEFMKRLRSAAKNPRQSPLAGLRIALDPGHMGGKIWDQRTGKYVGDTNGRVLSEGVLTLQTALLLERELQALGAEVLLTRRTIEAVSPLNFETFELREFALEEFRESQLMDWFQALIGKAPAGETLYRLFASNVDFKRLFSESMRWKYFIHRADLTARVEEIQRFSPDLTLIIHFDASTTGIDPKGYNATKAYVSGAFEKIEFASREDRKFFAHHMLDPVTWNASVHLSQSIVSRISQGLGVRTDPSGGSPSTRRIAPGVYSRNLHMNRRLVGAPVSYLECLFYNDPTEFKALAARDYEMRIGNETHSYSKRLVSLVNAIRDGIVQFAREFPKR